MFKKKFVNQSRKNIWIDLDEIYIEVVNALVLHIGYCLSWKMWVKPRDAVSILQMWKFEKMAEPIQMKFGMGIAYA